MNTITEEYFLICMCIIAKNNNFYRNSVNYKIKMCAYIYIYMYYIIYIINIIIL